MPSTLLRRFEMAENMSAGFSDELFKASLEAFLSSSYSIMPKTSAWPLIIAIT